MSSLLPPIGMETPCSSSATDAVLKVEGFGTVTFDPKGGIKYRVEPPDRPDSVQLKLRVLGFEVSADHDVLGKLRLTQAHIDTAPESVLEVLADNPPTFRQTTVVDVTLTIEKPPGGGGPLVLTNTSAMTLRCDNLPQFPPQRSTFALVSPVKLSRDGTAGKVLATLEKYSPIESQA